MSSKGCDVAVEMVVARNETHGSFGRRLRLSGAQAAGFAGQEYIEAFLRLREAPQPSTV